MRAPVVCTFSNGSVSLNTTASLINSTAATCIAPSWPVANFTFATSQAAGTAQVALTVASGGCALQRTFEYYRDPEIMGVFPLQGPRYGSFQLTVNLGASMDFASVDWVRVLCVHHLSLLVNLLG